MLNRDIYNKAPKENRLVNNGVAEVSEDHSEAAQGILRYELETFVCDGQYEKGLETILDKFLVNLDAGTEQPHYHRLRDVFLTFGIDDPNCAIPGDVVTEWRQAFQVGFGFCSQEDEVGIFCRSLLGGVGGLGQDLAQEVFVPNP